MAEPMKTARVRFLIISDTHNQHLGPDLEDSNCAFRKPLPEADVLLHCGDITNFGSLREYKNSIAMLKVIKAELKLVIAGNHDRSLDWEYWQNHRHLDEEEEEHQQAVDLWKGPEAHAAGVTYLDEGMYSFTLKSGATFSVYASPYQPEFCNWAFPYKRNEDRFNPPAPAVQGVKNIAKNPVPDFPKVDIMITHGPPLHRLDQTIRGDDVGCAQLLRAIYRAKPRISCFGHIHEGWGAEHLRWRQDHDKSAEDSVESITKENVDFKRAVGNMAAYVDGSRSGTAPINHGKTTLFVNAAIMDVDYSPNNAPWLVDLDLPMK